MIHSKTGEAGCPLYGPYIDLPAGSYTVTFRISADASNEECGHVDVCRDLGNKILVSKEFSGSSLSDAHGIIKIDFAVESAGCFEFRVHSNGNANLAIGQRSLAMDKDYLCLSGDIAKSAIILDEFFLTNFANFKLWSSLGARIQSSGSDYVISFRGIKVKVINAEDFQVMAEVMNFNDYNFQSKDHICVIDIGMNTGIASLYFANLPNVKEVHSFEPFAVPFNRALENFNLNPDLATKITPYNFGLGNRTFRDTVLYDGHRTIGVSVKGLGNGIPTEISVHRASETLSRIITAAKHSGLKSVIKMDCEGSEFAILEDLAKHDLLSEVFLYLIEWHKWWSADKTDENIVAPLVASGFVVLNQTHLTNPHAGPIYAFKAARSSPPFAGVALPFLRRKV
jgi:FkbM family methyltransferase